MTDKPYPTPDELDAEVASAMADHFLGNAEIGKMKSRADVERVMLSLFRCAMTTMPEIMKKYGPPPQPTPPAGRNGKPMMHRH